MKCKCGDDKRRGTYSSRRRLNLQGTELQPELCRKYRWRRKPRVRDFSGDSVLSLLPRDVVAIGSGLSGRDSDEKFVREFVETESCRSLLTLTAECAVVWI